jgi:hypothetical protein
MKQIFLMALVALTVASCQNAAKKSDAAVDSASTVVDSANTSTVSGTADTVKASGAAITFATPVYNFGTIQRGEKISYTYKFQNTGTAPLIITNAQATCGCTIPEIPKEPVKPGQTGELKVVFNSAGKLGRQDKVITVTSNASPATEMIHLQGEVLK